jgi:UDPglucose 6-dehydrogenase
MARISIVGGGYVGLVTAVCLAKLGHEVSCNESEARRREALLRGELPIYEPGLDDLFHRALDTQRLRFTGDYEQSIPGAEFVFICVNTPPRDDGSADVSNVFAAVRRISETATGPLILVIKSTVPVGTADEIEAFTKLHALHRMPVVSNPEFLRQGSAINDFLQPDRIVVGSEDPLAARAMRQLYDGISAPVITSSRRSAELAKYAANALLATRISFMNEIAALSSSCRADVDEIAAIIGSDRRIGPAYLKAGLGWGGSCFPKDVRALGAMAKSNGLSTPVIDGAYATNSALRVTAYRKIMDLLQGVEEPVVGILGLAFKPNTDDLREAPAIEIARNLTQQGIVVRAYDPVAMSKAAEVLPELEYCSDPYEAAQGADVLVLATEWPEFGRLDWPRVYSLVRGHAVIDGRNILDSQEVQASGLDYLPFGRATQSVRDHHIRTVPQLEAELAAAS